MKKIGLSLAVLGLSVGLAACGNTNNQSQSSQSESATKTTASQASSKASHSSRQATSTANAPAASSATPNSQSAATSQAPQDATTLGYRVFYTYLLQNGSPADIQTALEQHQLANIDVTDVSGKNVTSNYGKGVTGVFPAHTYTVSGTPLAAGTVTYQVIDENTVRVFAVPSHFQDQHWGTDHAWAQAQADAYMHHPTIMKVQTPSAQLLDLMKTTRDF